MVAEAIRGRFAGRERVRGVERGGENARAYAREREHAAERAHSTRGGSIPGCESVSSSGNAEGLDYVTGTSSQ